jgi:hypothetical protein
MSEIPTWAIEKALKPFLDHTPTAPWTAEAVLAEMDRPHGAKGFAAMVLAYAKLIAEHEEPPVDPFELELERVADETVDLWCASGGGQYVCKMFALAALRRGIEIGKQP